MLAGLVEPVSQSAQDSRDEQRCHLWRDGERGGDSSEVNLPAAHSRRPGHGRRSHAVSGWPVTSPAGEERPGSSAVRSALPSAAWGWGVGSQLRLTVQLLGASKTPHPAPGPGTPPHQGGEGPLPPEMFSEFPDGSRVGQLGKPTIRAFLDPACRSPSPDPEGEQGSQPAENPAQARAKQAVPASGRLGSPSPSQGGSPTPQTGRQALRVSCHLPLSCRCLRPVSRKPHALRPRS